MILPPTFSKTTDRFYEEGEQLWTSRVELTLEDNENKKLQRVYDHPLLEMNLKRLLDAAATPTQKARLTAVSSKESGAWLDALPVSALGNLLDDETFRISIGLRLGSSLYVRHKCKCGTEVDESGVHGLSCKFSAGRRSRHDTVNDLIKRSLNTAKVPSILEPSGVSREDGKRPDGMTMIPWKLGKPAIWDFTCVDTMAPSHLNSSSVRQGAAAETAEKIKFKKYESLEKFYLFYPIAIETYGVFGSTAMSFIREIGKKLFEITNDNRSTSFLIQRISIAIQRGNAASVLGTIPVGRQLDEFFIYPRKRKHQFNEENSEIKKIPNSPKIIRSGCSPSRSISSSINSSASSRCLIDKGENYGNREYSDDDSSGEQGINNYSTIRSHNQVKTLGLNGLKNIGNTCFMNSVIQCLSNTRWLLEYLQKDAYLKDINTSISSMNGALIKAFAEVIKELWSEDLSDRVVNTVSLKNQIQRFAPRFLGYAQQDAHEFLRYLLEGLHEDVNRVTEKPKSILTEIDHKLSDYEKVQESWSRYLRMDNSKIVDNFVGQLKSTLKCNYCGHCSVTFDPFWDLSLQIPKRTGIVRLPQCLESFTREETLDGDEKPTCLNCKERRKFTKSFLINKFPKVLVIHLKRFSSTAGFGGKLNMTVDFPIDGLDLSNYSVDSISPFRYNLYAMLNHSGTTFGGHYTAYCRHPYAGIWHEYNDSRVSPISSKSLVGGEAYVLFYEQEDTQSHL